MASTGMMFQEQKEEQLEQEEAEEGEVEEKINRICKRKRLVPAPGSALALMQKKSA